MKNMRIINNRQKKSYAGILITLIILFSASNAGGFELYLRK